MAINDNINHKDSVTDDKMSQILMQLDEPHPEVSKYLSRCTTDNTKTIVKIAVDKTADRLKELLVTGQLTKPIQEEKLNLFLGYLNAMKFEETLKNETTNIYDFTLYDPYKAINEKREIEKSVSTVDSKITLLSTKTLYYLVRRVLKDTQKDNNLYPFYFRDSFQSPREDDYKVYLDAFTNLLIREMTNLLNSASKETLVVHFSNLYNNLLEDIESRRVDRYNSHLFGDFLESEVAKTGSELKEIFNRVSVKASNSRIAPPKDFRKFSLSTYKPFADLVEARDEDIIRMEFLLKYLHVLGDK